jgi:hypothetical protein
MKIRVKGDFQARFRKNAGGEIPLLDSISGQFG